MVRPERYGASIAAADNTAALTAAFGSGRPVLLDGAYKSAGPIKIDGCPAIYGEDPASDGILFTGKGGGLVIDCPSVTGNPATGHVVLKDFFINTSSAGGGTALVINFGAQTPATVALPSLDMEGLHISGDLLSAHYWNDGAVVTNGQEMRLTGNWISGDQADRQAMASGISLTNTANVPSMADEIFDNSIYQTATAIAVTMSGRPAIEGLAIRDNVLVTNDTAISIDGSGADYVPPSFLISGNQTNSVVQSLYLNKVAQVYVSSNTFYTSGATGNGISLNGRINTVFIVHNFVLGINRSGGTAISAAGGPGFISENVLQDFATGVYLAPGSANWYVQPDYYIGVTNPVEGTSRATASLN